MLKMYYSTNDGRGELQCCRRWWLWEQRKLWNGCVERDGLVRSNDNRCLIERVDEPAASDLVHKFAVVCVRVSELVYVRVCGYVCVCVA